MRAIERPCGRQVEATDHDERVAAGADDVQPRA
jgi:hypothetical protein